MAPGGQALTQTWQFAQKSSAPMSLGVSASNGMSVVTAESRKDEPNSSLMSEPCFPSVPSPAWLAAGIMFKADAKGPCHALASYPCDRMKLLSSRHALAARLY